MLFTICKENNPSSYFITHPDELDDLNIPAAERIGITGATSTPQWLIEGVAEKLRE
jgi:4-hydroxy-3-methylbut-2-enyl diphosphate reductase